jgi:hypothetical protein
MISPVKTWYKSVALWLGTAAALAAAASTVFLLRQYQDRIVTLEGELEQARAQTVDVTSRLAREKKELADQAALFRQMTQDLDSETKRASQAELLAASEQRARQVEATRLSRAEQVAREQEDARKTAEARVREQVDARKIAEARLREQVDARKIAEARAREQEDARKIAEARAREQEDARKTAAARVREQEDARKTATARVQESKRQSWCVARLRNETTISITYQLIDDNGARNFADLRPGQELILTGRTASMTIRFDSSMKAGYQEGRNTLLTVKSIDHQPSDLDMRTAPVNYFNTINGVNIELRVRAN